MLYGRNMKHYLAVALCAAFFLCALLVTEPVKAEDSFTVSSPSSVSFTVSRPESIAQLPQTLTLRIFNITAVKGVHFKDYDTSKTLNFKTGDTSKTVTLYPIETSMSIIPTVSKYQAGLAREYGVELLDEAGVCLWSGIKTITRDAAYQISAEMISSHIENLLYIKGSDFATDMTGAYVDIPITGSSYTKVTDAGYKQGKHTASLNALYTAIPQEYLQAVSAKVYAVVGFTMKEEDDGYQYIQILADNDSTHDGDDSGSNVNTPSKSVYKACFELSGFGSPKIISSDFIQYFPHKNNYKNRLLEQNSNNWSEFPNNNTLLHEQEFKATSYRASDTGAMVLPSSTGSVTIRFDAAGEDDDTWYFKNLFLRAAACDNTAPILSNVLIDGGSYAPGSELSISLQFNEIVQAAGTQLNTSWGTLTCNWDFTPSDVVTYRGTFSETGISTGDSLQITGLTGTIQDLAGNAFAGINPFTLSSVTAAQPYAYSITYNLDGGSVSDNPASYTIQTETFTLNQPVREGYIFVGWTGYGLTEITQEVTIPKGSRGKRVYTAIWTRDLNDADGVRTWAELQNACNEGGNIRLEQNITAGQEDAALTIPAGKEVYLDLAGSTLSRGLNSGKNGGNVITVCGNLTVTDNSNIGTGKITGGHNDCLYAGDPISLGGGVYVLGGGSFTLESGTIYNCTVSHDSGIKAQGGGVYVSDGGAFTMTGGTINICRAIAEEYSAEGGGVFVASGGTFTMTGGTISSCDALIYRSYYEVRGGGVYVNEYGTFTMTGGMITGCKAHYAANSCSACEGNNVYVAQKGIFNISGSPVIADRTGSQLNFQNIYLPNKVKLHVIAALDETALISLNTYEDPTDDHPVVVADCPDGYATEKNFISDRIGCTIVLENNEAVLKVQAPIASWAELQEALNEGGYITLTRSVTAGENDSALVIPSDVTVHMDLNSCTLDRGLNEKEARAGGNVFTVEGTLELWDSSTYSGGRVTGANNTGNGGGIYIAPGGTLFLSHGSPIRNNKAAAGGGVYVSSGSTFSMGGYTWVENNYGTGGRADNIFLDLGTVINITDRMYPYSSSGIMTAAIPTKATPVVITSGLPGKGSSDYFTSNMPGCITRLNANSECVLSVEEFGVTDFLLPADISTVESEAFAGVSMRVVYVPDGCKSIGANAFYGCTDLTQIRLPQYCDIDSTAFNGCGTIYVFAPAGGTTETFCNDPSRDNLIFVPETED